MISTDLRDHERENRLSGSRCAWAQTVTPAPIVNAERAGAECHYLRLATHYVEQSALEDLIDRIVKAPTRLKGAVGAASGPIPEAKIEQNLPAVARLFASDRLEDVFAALAAA